MNFVAVRGKGNPNEDKGEYKEAMQMLYGIAYTIKMSKMGDRDITTKSTLVILERQHLEN